MTVKEIVEKYLLENGFGGLCGHNCGCRIGDLMCCGDGCAECEPGYKHLCDTCPEETADNCEFHTKGEWCIRHDKPKGE